MANELQPGLGIPAAAVQTAAGLPSIATPESPGPVTSPDVPTEEDIAILNEGKPVDNPELAPEGTQPVVGGPGSLGPVTSPGEVEDASPTQPVRTAPLSPGKKLSPLDEMEARQKAEVDADTEAVAAAQAKQSQITTDYYRTSAEAAKMRSDLQLSWAAAEDRANSEAKAESAKYIAAYQQQIAAVRQMAVDPTGPIGRMSTGEASGMSLAMFAQGFLAARGIHIDVGGQIDRWVDRSIHEQERRIQQAEAGANDQLHLWEIAKQTSRDDFEARQRYRGFVIAALQAQTDQHAALYQSDLANAQAAEKVARLQMEADTTKRGIETDHYKMVRQDLMDRATRAHMGAENALLAAEADAKRAEAAKLRAETEANKNKSPQLVPIKDIDTGEVKWAIDASTPEGRAQAKEALEGTVNDRIMLDALKNLKEKYLAAYSYAQQTGGDSGVKDFISGLAGGPGALLTGKLGAQLNEKVRDFQRARSAAEIALASYGRVRRFNEYEMKKFEEQMPGESGWQVGNNANAIDDLIEQVRGKAQATVDAYATPIKGADPTMAPRLKAAHTISTASAASNAPVKDDIRDQLGKAEDKTSQNSYFPATAAWSTLGGSDSFDGYSGGEGHMPASFLAVEHLALATVDPSEFRKYATHPLSDNDNLVSTQAEMALKDLANDTSKPAHEYARRLLKAIKEDPDKWRTILLSDSSSEEASEAGFRGVKDSETEANK